MSKEKRHSRRPRKQRPIPIVALSVDEWIRATGISHSSTYRMMAGGMLRFVQLGGRRKIPAHELQRLGLTEAA